MLKVLFGSLTLSSVTYKEMGGGRKVPYKSLKDFNSETIVCGSLLGNKYFNIFSAFANLDLPFVL